MQSVKKYVAEFIGSFVLVFFACGTAAVVGCSAETEASFETIAFLANKVDELNLKYLIVLENSSDKIANTIIKNSKNKNQEILILNSIQSCTKTQIANGLSYFDVMSKNLEVLKKALY